MGVQTIFGPILSRRLGRSLGVNNVFRKYCSYSCIYCQAGRTTNLTIERRKFHEPESVLRELESALKSIDWEIDYVTFVPNGEPTLDSNLGEEISLIKDLGVKIAIITNSSLLFREDVRRDLWESDLVSLKVDSVREESWRKINRPHRALSLNKVMEGMREFSSEYSGRLLTETMVIGNFKYKEKEIEEISHFIGELDPEVAYLSLPVRPPSEKRVTLPTSETLNKFKEARSSLNYKVLSEDVEQEVRVEDLPEIVKVHPIKVNSSIKDHPGLKVVEYSGKKYYVPVEKEKN